MQLHDNKNSLVLFERKMYIVDQKTKYRKHLLNFSASGYYCMIFLCLLCICELGYHFCLHEPWRSVGLFSRSAVTATAWQPYGTYLATVDRSKKLIVWGDQWQILRELWTQFFVKLHGIYITDKHREQTSSLTFNEISPFSREWIFSSSISVIHNMKKSNSIFSVIDWIFDYSILQTVSFIDFTINIVYGKKMSKSFNFSIISAVLNSSQHIENW